MAYWLFKSEPEAFSWSDLKKLGAKGSQWDGVRNYQARNNMRKMQVGDLGFFYHSNEGKEVVGVCRVIATVHPSSLLRQIPCILCTSVHTMGLFRSMARVLVVAYTWRGGRIRVSSARPATSAERRRYRDRHR